MDDVIKIPENLLQSNQPKKLPIEIPKNLLDESSTNTVTACNACETYCQQMCEDISCQCTFEGCQTSQGCTACQWYCQQMCEDISCQCTFEGCQTGQGCNACEHYCQQMCEDISCQCTYEGCQTVCESTCQQTCQNSCQQVCENTCQQTCQSSCQISCQCSDQSNQGPSVPGQPSLSLVSKSDTSVTLSLVHPSGTWTSLEIHVYLSGGSSPISTYSYTSGGNKTISGLSPNTTYVFYAQAFNSGVSGSYSSAVVVTTDPTVIIPSPPTNVTKTIVGRRVTISFTKGANATDTYIDINGDGTWDYSGGATSVEFTNLSWGTTYTARLRSYNSTYGTWSSEVTITFTTDYQYTPNPPVNVSASVNGREVTFSWYITPPATRVEIDKESDGIWDIYVTLGIFTYTVQMPNYNTTYTARFRAYSSTYESYSSIVTITFTTGSYPTPGSPSNIIVSVDGLNVYVTFTKGTDATKTQLREFGTNVGYETTGSSFSFTVSQYDKTYTYEMRSFREDYGTYSPWVQFSFMSGPSPVPQPFSWRTPKVKGYAIKNNLNNEEWNEFTTSINAFRRYKGLSNYSFTYAITGQKFTAKMFNEAVNAINDMSPPVPPPATVADPQPANLVLRDRVTADRLNKLVSSLNSLL